MPCFGAHDHTHKFTHVVFTEVSYCKNYCLLWHLFKSGWNYSILCTHTHAKFRDTIHVQNTCSVGSQKLEEMMWVAIRNIHIYWSVIIFHNIKYSIVVMDAC